MQVKNSTESQESSPITAGCAAFLDAIPIGIALVDRLSLVRFANRSLRDLFKKPLCEFVGKRTGEAFSCLEHFTTKDGCGFGDHCDACVIHHSIESTFREGVSAWDALMQENFSINGDNKTLWLNIGTELVEVDDQEFTMVAIVDATKNIEFNLELANARDQAKSAEQTKSQFLATISHELRTPLNGILGLANLLMASDLDEEHRTYIEMIEESGTSLLGLVNDVLDYSHLDTGLIRPHPTQFDLARHIDETVGMILPKARDKGIEFSYFIDPSITMPLTGDPGRIRQILMNLLSNAIKFTERGGQVSLQIDCEARDEDSWKIRFSVSDNGIGIPENELEEIFERFVQLDATNTRKYGGTGLGLAICRQLCTLMGSRIEVASTPGAGSTFSFILPMPCSEPSADEVAIVDPFLKGRRVIFCGPESNCSVVLLTYLERWGAQVEWAMDVEGLPPLLGDSTDTQGSILLIDTGSGWDEATIRDFLCLVEGESVKWISLTDPLSPINTDSRILTQAEAVVEMPVSRRGLKRCLLQFGDNSEDKTGAYCHSDRITIPTSDAASPPDTPSLKILLAEDNAIHRKITFRMLTKLGHSVTCCQNGMEVIQELNSFPYDILIIDCHMPGMNGFETTMKVREMGVPFRDIPILALTADISHENQAKCIEVGMNDFLSKPVRLESIAVALTPYSEQKAHQLDWVI